MKRKSDSKQIWLDLNSLTFFTSDNDVANLCPTIGGVHPRAEGQIGMFLDLAAMSACGRLRGVAPKLHVLGHGYVGRV